VFQESCVDMGLPSHEGTWTAYADDIADKSLGEEEASQALQQLEAASAFVGLRLNVPKTEVMARGVKKVEDGVDKPASKERVSIKIDGTNRQGWLLEARHSHLIGIQVQLNETTMTRPMLISFDDGDHMVADDRGANWLRDQNNVTYRFRRLGFEVCLDKKQNNKFMCESCQTNFDSAPALRTHIGGKWCRQFDDMTIEQQSRLRKTRIDSATRRGKSVRKVEMVTVLTCENSKIKSCGEFTYLGSKIITSASATPEIRRRIGMAMATFGRLYRIWKSKIISRRLKAALYNAIILSIMLYNAEVWPIKAQDLKSLEGAHFMMMRSMMASEVPDQHFKREFLLEALGLRDIAVVITRKRLSWIGHALRRSDNDKSRIAVTSELNDTSSKWTKLVLTDCRKVGINLKGLQNLALDRRAFRRKVQFIDARAQDRAHSLEKALRFSSMNA
jgi:hypothetical protein